MERKRMVMEQATPDFLEIAAPAHRETEGTGVQQMKVLLVEDSDSDAGLIMANLRATDTNYGVHWAISVESAIYQLQTEHFDVVLLDLNLSDSTGLATLELFLAEFPLVPVIVLTGLDDRELATEAVWAGAQDYVAKARADGDTLDRAIRYARERSRRRLAESKLRLNEYELAAARKIQQFLIPKCPPELAGLDIAGDCRPTAATGGDFFDYFAITADRLGLVAGDVSSHGLGPALVMAETRCLVRSLAKAHNDPAEILTMVNHALMEDSPDDVFVTLFLAILNIHTRTLLFSGAGHGAHVLGPAGQVNALASTSVPLGIVEDADYSQMKLHKLIPGEILVLVTDGFQEAERADGGRFGIEQVLTVVHTVRHKPAREILEVLFDFIFTYCRPDIPHDDLTAVIVKVNN